MIVRVETDADTAVISELVTDVFRNGAEARLIERLRDEGHIAVSLVAAVHGRIAGSVVFSHLPICAEDRTIAAAALAPLAVHPDYQRLGIGAALVNEGMRICKLRGKDAVIVLGDPQYYARFGFSCDLAAGIESAYSGSSFMALELIPGALRLPRGAAKYPAPFDEVS